jgi:hypothetical protein
MKEDRNLMAVVEDFEAEDKIMMKFGERKSFGGGCCGGFRVAIMKRVVIVLD